MALEFAALMAQVFLISWVDCSLYFQIKGSFISRFELGQLFFRLLTAITELIAIRYRAKELRW